MTRRRVVALAAAFAAVLLVAGYLLTTTSHRLEQGSSSWHGADAELRTAGPKTEWRYTFVPGGQVTFGASIRNPGPWPVTITDVAVNDRPDVQLFRIARLTMIYSDGKTAVVYGPDVATPFRATTVAVGAELSVFATVTIPDVEMAPGSSLYFDDLAVNYEVLGMHRHQRVPMGFYVTVHAAENGAAR